MTEGVINCIGGPDDGVENCFAGDISEIIGGPSHAIPSKKVWQQVEYKRDQNADCRWYRKVPRATAKQV